MTTICLILQHRSIHVHLYNDTLILHTSKVEPNNPAYIIGTKHTYRKINLFNKQNHRGIKYTCSL